MSATLENAQNMLSEAQDTLSENNLNESKTQMDGTVNTYIAKFDTILSDIKIGGETILETMQQLRDSVAEMKDINISEQMH